MLRITPRSLNKCCRRHHFSRAGTRQRRTECILTTTLPSLISGIPTCRNTNRLALLHNTPSAYPFYFYCPSPLLRFFFFLFFLLFLKLGFFNTKNHIQFHLCFSDVIALQVFTKANAAGAMCSYAALNGVPSCANDWLLNGVLRQQWGREDAFISTDCKWY